MAFECMEDCIHLKACRRIQKIGKTHGLFVPRYCTEDCSCYLSGETESGFISIEEAVDYAREGASSILSGYGTYDVYATIDLQGSTLSEILENKGGSK